MRSLRSDTDRARRRTDDIGFDLVSHLPLVGDDAAAVQAVADSVDRIADDALQPVVTAAGEGGLGAFKPDGGRIDVTGLARMEQSLTTANRVLFAERIRAERIDPNRLVGRLAVEVRDFQSKIAKAEETTHAAAAAAAVGPALLGADGPRNYLLMFQNNAEVRSTGGLPGAFVILRADHGRLTIGEPSSAGEFLGIDEPVLPLTREEKSIYPPLLATDIRDVTFTPDFPRAAQLARAIVKAKLGRTVDGVLSMDPVALSYLLRATGPVEIVDGDTLTADNAVATLLQETYAKFPDPQAQDAYFAMAAQRIFETVASGAGDSTEVVQALTQGVREHRVMFWSARKHEQGRIEEFELANRLPRSTERPQVGVYLNDATLAKMQYYLHTKTAVRSVACSSGQVQTLRLTTTLRSDAPAGGRGLPDYVVGGAGKVARGNQLVIVRFYGPSGGSFTRITVDGRRRPVDGLTHHHRPVTGVVVDVKPGQTITIAATAKTRSGQGEDGLLMTTPGVFRSMTTKTIYSYCND